MTNLEKGNQLCGSWPLPVLLVVPRQHPYAPAAVPRPLREGWGRLSKELPEVTRLAESPFARALEDRLIDWSERTGVVVEVWALPKTEVPAPVADAVLATMTEALENVERHSGAGQVSVALTVSQSGLRLTVSDDGRGMPAGATGGGLARMRANFAALGGSLSVNGVPGGGTTVSGAVPVRAV